MGDIHDLYPRWVDKETMAKRLGVSQRTVYAMWKRGELLRKVEKGNVLWSNPQAELRKRKGEVSSLVEQHASSEASGVQRKAASDGSKRGHFEPNPLYLELKEEREKVVRLQEQNTQLQVELARVQTALVHVERERDALRRSVKAQRWGFFVWFKGWLDSFRKP